jgi:hypothetical protein
VSAPEKTPGEALRELFDAIVKELHPVLDWMDRQLRRWPRLYRYLSK